MSTVDLLHRLQADQMHFLAQLRQKRREMTVTPAAAAGEDELTFGQRVADNVAATMGSWPFIILQSMILLAWIALNLTAWIRHWDPYPFILLNLALSFQAAYAAPFIMMSQNRQQDVDRRKAADDYEVNIKCELEIELLHQKLDQLREQEIRALAAAVSDLSELLRRDRPAEPSAL
jgi:uncharacterized membrane protein